MKFAPITENIPTRAQYVFDVVREAIVSGQLAPGETIVQSKLASQLGVSDIPVREALRRLEGIGLVTHVPHMGCVVKVFDSEEMKELLETRLELEILALRKSIPFLTSEDYRSLQEVLVAAQNAICYKDYNTFSQLNRTFHKTLYGRCPNNTLLNLLDELWDRSEVARRLFKAAPTRIIESHNEHKALLELVSQDKTDQAVELLWEHKEKSFNLLFQQMKENEGT